MIEADSMMPERPVQARATGEETRSLIAPFVRNASPITLAKKHVVEQLDIYIEARRAGVKTRWITC